MDWLNQRSSEDTEFFGVVVEVWKIDDSRPAPHFRVVSAPNDWHKSNVKIRSTGDPSPQQERYRAFFQNLIDTLREEHRFTGARKAQPQSWYSFNAGHGNRLRYGANFHRDGVRVEVYIDNGDQVWNKDIFDQLSDSVKRFNLPLKVTSSGIGIGWKIVGQVEFQSSARAASATTRKPWTKFTNGWSRTSWSSSEYSALTWPIW